MEWEQPQLVALRFQPHPLLFRTGWSPPGSGSQADWNLLSQPTLLLASCRAPSHFILSHTLGVWVGGCEGCVHQC